MGFRDMANNMLVIRGNSINYTYFRYSVKLWIIKNAKKNRERFFNVRKGESSFKLITPSDFQWRSRRRGRRKCLTRARGNDNREAVGPSGSRPARVEIPISVSFILEQSLASEQPFLHSYICGNHPRILHFRACRNIQYFIVFFVLAQLFVHYTSVNKRVEHLQQ